MVQKGIVCLIFLSLLGCEYAKKPQQKTASAPARFSNENRQLQDSAIRLLRSGDLVFRLGNDITSAMLSQLNLREKKYSHCGIVIVENGNTYIYHSIGGELNPDQKIKRELPAQWFSPVNNLAIAIARPHLDSSQIKKLADKVHSFYKEEKKFDMEFDLATDDRLYCAEMIYKSVISAAKDSLYFPTTSAFGKKYVGIDDLYANPHSTVICRVQYK